MVSPNQWSEREPGAMLPLDDSIGPALRISDRRAEELVDVVMQRFDRVTPSRGVRRLPRWLLAAAVLGIAGGAAATAIVLTRSAPPAPPAVGPAAPVEPAESETGLPRAPQRPEATSVDSETEPEATPEQASSQKPATQEQRVQAAQDLLKSANALRGQGRWREAERAYSGVMSRFPGTSQAYVATLAAASLRLEHLRDPAGALNLYQAVLKGGSLGEEAQFGVARCHRAMGNTSGEAAALRQFVATRPGSLLRDQAERRLRQIEGGR
jgi:hypothetical protein